MVGSARESSPSGAGALDPTPLQFAVTPRVQTSPPMPNDSGWPGPPPPPSESWVGISVVIAAVVVVTVVAVAGFAFLVWSASNERFTCPGVAWKIDYTGSASGYFGAYPATGCLGNPLAEPHGYGITILLSLVNAARSASHEVSSIAFAQPTSLNSTSPSLPVTISPGGTLNITIDVTIPTLHGDYVVDGVITTS
jgi:hypothetical protein